jgi:hypothetical protein
MSVLNKIAYFQDRRDELPNQDLAQELAETKNRDGIHEIAANLGHKNRRIQSDCLKVLYEIGYLDPELVSDYAAEFLNLLKNKQNRLVWGSMIALSTIAEIRAEKLFDHYETIRRTMEQGSVITVDAGVLTLAKVAAQNAAYSKRIFPYLIDHLATCRPKDVPQHAEKILLAVNVENKAAFLGVIDKRMTGMKSSQLRRLRKVVTVAEER